MWTNGGQSKQKSNRRVIINITDQKSLASAKSLSRNKVKVVGYLLNSFIEYTQQNII